LEWEIVGVFHNVRVGNLRDTTLRSTLYGVEALEFRAFAAVALVLLLAALLACLLPALRASKVDPIEALRSE
jgi:putative ABC transport system permease protein